MVKLVIQDTAEVLVTKKKNGKVVMMGEAQVAGISQSVSEEILRGGIGNKAIFMIRSDKEMTLNVTSATFDMDYLALTQGVEINESGTAEVTKSANLKVEGGAVAIPNAPSGLSTAILRDKDGSQDEVAVVTGSITLPEGSVASDGDVVEVFYKASVTGRSIELNAAKFSDKYKVEYRTIAYNVENASVYSDIYFIFEETIPSGNFDLSLESGSAYAPELNFTVMSPVGTDEMGQMIEELRA